MKRLKTLLLILLTAGFGISTAFIGCGGGGGGGGVGAAFQVNSSSTKYAVLPLMSFDGTNFLVTWSDGRNDADHDGICDAGEGTCWDVYGQYISKSGALVGSEFVINNDADNQLGFVTGFNAGKYLVIVDTGVTLGTWVFGDVYGVFVTP
ncbi:MAG: hypothetical protein A2Z59_11020 [Nitrospinae bacterium RIFCSPLOWO2_02_39_17]|nr:MAG: hypothetical protein A2Z59_11020 [Nitrospinae bacterium RIFCSPLOWO2_02_39_17]